MDHTDLPAIGRPATRALSAAGVTHLAQLAEWTERDLQALHGVGPKAIRTLTAAMAERGISLRAG